MNQHIHNTSRGVRYLLSGLKRLPEPGIRSFVLIPLLINILVFAGLIWLAVAQFSNLMDAMLGWLPEWLSFLTAILWPLFAVTILLMLFFSFTIVANLIAAPFNGFLAEKIQRELDPECMPEGGWKELAALVPRTIVRELQKLMYYLPRALGLLILTFIPVVQVVAPFLWALFSAWMMAVQYCDYAADNEEVKFRPMLIALGQPKLQTMAFGGLVSLFTIIPLVNLLVMPAAVIGGTQLWVERRQALKNR